MKKVLILFLSLVSFGSYSQITLDFQSPNPNLVHIKLNNNETKYKDAANVINQNQCSLYNIDGSFFKNILIPPNPNPSAQIYSIGFFSTSTFDNDSTTIEFLTEYQLDSAGYAYYEVRIIREDGTVLLDEMNAQTYYLYPYPVYGTEDGTKLMLYYSYANYVFYQVKVFNLPGVPPAHISDKLDNNSNDFLLFPNPNNGTFYIKMQSNDSDLSTIELLAPDGKVINTYQSISTSTKINVQGLPDGMYLLNARSNSFNNTQRIIIKK